MSSIKINPIVYLIFFHESSIPLPDQFGTSGNEIGKIKTRFGTRIAFKFCQIDFLFCKIQFYVCQIEFWLCQYHFYLCQIDLEKVKSFERNLFAFKREQNFTKINIQKIEVDFFRFYFKSHFWIWFERSGAKSQKKPVRGQGNFTYLDPTASQATPKK